MYPCLIPLARWARSLVTYAAVLIALIPPAPARAAEAGLAMARTPYYDTTIPYAIWYPTATPGTPMHGGPFEPTVARDAPPADGARPLVLISHGTGGMLLNHYPIAVALARAGFIVASLTHPGDNYLDRSLAADARYFTERPRQVSRVIDALLADPQWAPRIDAARIAVIGHSAGGYTAAALVGGLPDRQRLIAHCRAVDDDPSCRFRDPSVGRVMADDAHARLQLPDALGADMAVADPRIRAAVLLAPLGVPITPGSLARGTARVRLIGAGADEVLAQRYHYDPLAAELPPGAASLAAGSTHYSFIAPVAPAFVDRLGPIAQDPPGFDRERFQRTLAGELSAWMVEAIGRPPAVPETAARSDSAPRTQPAADAGARLEIVVAGVGEEPGLLMVALYASEADFRKTPIRTLQLEPHPGEVRARIEGLASGDYAALVFQDLDGDGKLGRGLMGIPTEPWGGSLNGRMVFGAPGWSDLRFSLPEGGGTARLELRR